MPDTHALARDSAVSHHSPIPSPPHPAPARDSSAHRRWVGRLPMPRARIPFDVGRLSEAAGAGMCFICELLHGNPRFEHVVIAETETAIAFLNRFPTLFGYVLVAPKSHVEQVTGDFVQSEYVELQRFIYVVAEAVRRVLEPERVYLLSLGSQANNAHVHWHVAPLPHGVPFEQQQYHALMHENGVIEVTPEEMAELARKLRAEIDAHGA